MPRLLPPPHKALADTAGLRRKRLATAWRILRDKGPRALASIAMHRYVSPALANSALRLRIGRMERMVASRAPGRAPLVVFSTVDYAFPYRQRPQHLALAFARLGHPVFYLSPRSGHDSFVSAGFPAPMLCVTDADEALPGLMPEPPILLTMSTDNRIDGAFLDRVRDLSPRLVYDYIDHIDPAISMMEIPPGRIESHRRLLADESVLVAASAKVLYDEAATQRRRGLVLAQNAVDVEHFGVQRREAGLAPELQAAIRRGRPIAGYFGALASWFDYDLVARLAESRPDISVVLIGPDYDGSARAWRAGKTLPGNLFFVSAIPYDRLPAQAVWFDVALIPFVVNDITLATSPLKLYEYFAMRLPVVSTPLPECQRHQPAVLVADGVQDFSQAVDRALALRGDPAHQARLAREARDNDWRARVEVIVAGLKEL